MATHGRSGLSRWWYGSVASKLVRQAPVPTLIVGPKPLEGGVPTAAIRRILVPLDSSALAETALQPARELAEVLGADLMLAQVVRWTAQAFTFGPADVDVAQIDRDLTDAAQQYLAQAREGLRTQRSVETRLLHGLPADALIDLTAAEKIDLVVMASHTRSGLARAALGSVADRMLQGKAPVLLIRPEAMPAVVHAPRGRYCHNCGRASPHIELMPDDRCLRCGQHLRACANCVYYDGIGCLLQRPEVHDTYPGRDCPEFQFRETPARAPDVGRSQGRTAEKK
jgi:nucleotide-binding universal stress UspA family protein